MISSPEKQIEPIDKPDIIKRPFPARAGNYDDPESEQSFGNID